MAGLFQRLFTLGSSEAHGLVDKLEDPVKLTEQGIRDLKVDLAKSKDSFAIVKSQSMNLQKDIEKARQESVEWENKAKLLLTRSEKDPASAPQNEKLAIESLKRRDEAKKKMADFMSNHEQQSKNVGKLEQDISKLQSLIEKYENELKTLRARATTAKATEKINRQLAQVDPGGTIEMLERARQKVQDQESLAEAYGETSRIGMSLEDEIQGALGSTAGDSSYLKELDMLKGGGEIEDQSPHLKELEALKAQIGKS